MVDKTICSIRPCKKFLYLILVSEMILFICIFTDIPPKEKNISIIIPLIVSFDNREVKKTPFVKSNKPLIIICNNKLGFRMFVKVFPTR